jgi:hypothetical protein
MNLMEFLKFIIPPFITHIYQKSVHETNHCHYDLSGDYNSWESAVAASTGYDSELILEKTKSALLKVKNG